MIWETCRLPSESQVFTHFAQSGSRLAISGKVLKGLERRREAEAALYEMRWY
jgi:GH24 family phage-related lysozyme (muramidase)